MRPTLLGALTALLAALLATPPATAAPPRIESRGVVFDVSNINETSVPCTSDGQQYHLRGRLVGPTKDLDGVSGALRVNVLVHDLGAGGWFWNLRSHPAYDYATRLAAQGETTLVLDRLGYGASRLADGNATCLGAQANMLHQVVQHLTSGRYDYTSSRFGATPAAAHVVTHGLGIGAAIAQVEAGTFDDVDGLVLMSWTDRGATSLATRAAARHSRDCVGTDYAPRPSMRELFFSSASGAVRRAVVHRQDDDPCGDVGSLSPLVLGSNLEAREVDAPVLLLYGGKDKVNRASAREDQAASYSTRVTTRTFPGAGYALPLEKQAGQVRAAVLRWLR
ncbi:alpha/beta hydrolase [Nocardioides aquiterrae]|uniref:AB hydrolase-1 domain-containing protein n=1 Tax=Nocardioides aquiterrae TaxID=203799 RepID=A0ABN1U982_9ACTN